MGPLWVTTDSLLDLGGLANGEFVGGGGGGDALEEAVVPGTSVLAAGGEGLANAVKVPDGIVLHTRVGDGADGF